MTYITPNRNGYKGYRGINADRLVAYGSGNLSFKAFDKVVQGKYREWGIKYGTDGSSYARNYADYHDNMESAKTNPRLKFYLDSLTSLSPKRRSPWQAEGERLIAQLQVGSVINDGSDDASPPWFVHTLDNDKHQLEISELQVTNTNAIAHPHTRTFLFRDEVIKTAFSMPLPKHTITTDLLILDSMFWVFETSVPISIESSNIQGLQNLISHNEPSMAWVGPDGKEYPSHTVLVDWLLIWAGEKKIHVTISILGVSNTINLQLMYEDGTIFDADSGSIPRFIFSILAFINTPMIHNQQDKNPRRVRKQLERLKKKTGDKFKDSSQTSVIYLRRPQAKKNTGEESDKSKRDFQWWVSGHYRSQWYGSTGTHKLIWIAPFLKGEKGMPVKDVTYMVVR